MQMLTMITDLIFNIHTHKKYWSTLVLNVICLASLLANPILSSTNISSAVSINVTCALGGVERCVFYRQKKAWSDLKDKDGKTIETVTTEMAVTNEPSVNVTVIPSVVVPMPVTKITNGQVMNGKSNSVINLYLFVIFWPIKKEFASNKNWFNELQLC